MPREIWSEGRVVGYSAYEIYVKQHLSEDPETVPATEREWLASSLAMGSSMLLRVPDVNATTSTQHTYVDIPLPANSKLAAANTIVAQFFDGSGVFESAQSNWAVRISDYGSCISNTAQSSPDGYVGPGGSIPSKTPADYTDLQKTQLSEYLRIYDGIFIQPGTWVDNNAKPPQKDFQADLSKPYPRIRLHVRGKIKNKPLILLTGFTIRSVLAGTVGQDTCTETGSPQDGDFLGPAVFPWAAKVVFCVPNSYVTYFESTTGYERLLPTPSEYTENGSKRAPRKREIKDIPVIDMQASKLEDYYRSDDYQGGRFTYNRNYQDPSHPTYGDPWYPFEISKVSPLLDTVDGDGTAVLTTFRRLLPYPPALYGTFATSADASGARNHALLPIDVVAPGTVKMFFNQPSTTLEEYEDKFPGTTAMNRNADGTIELLDVTDVQNRKVVKVADISMTYLHNSSNLRFYTPVSLRTGSTSFASNQGLKLLKTQVGGRSAYSFMMSPDIADQDHEPDQIDIQKIPPEYISQMNDRGELIYIDNVIRLDKAHVHHGSGEDSRFLTRVSDMLMWSALVQALVEKRPIDLLGERLRDTKVSLTRQHSGSAGPYISFGPVIKTDITQGGALDPTDQAIRLYISNVKPEVTDVPIGSIGIGWGFVSPS